MAAWFVEDFVVRELSVNVTLNLVHNVWISGLTHILLKQGIEFEI